MKFEVGNKVYCSYHEATGTIKDIRPIGTYPILVTFEDGTTDTYTTQGSRLDHGNICLKLIEKEPDSLTLEYVEGLGKSIHTILWNSSLKNIRKHSHNTTSNI